jgi:hypothetical protein
MNNDVVIIELDRPREIRYGYKALKTLVAMTGKDIEKLMDSDDMSFEDIEKVIYCGILADAQKNGETLKLEDMEDLLDLKPLQYTLEKMNEAFTKAFGNPEEQEKNE